MPYQVQLPDGTFVLVADNVPQTKALELAKTAYPDAFPKPPSIGEQLLGLPKEIGKGFLRGIAVDPVSGIASLGYTGAQAAGMEGGPFEKTGVGQALSRAQTALAPGEGTISEFGGGLGSLLSFIPGGLLKGGLRAATLFTQAGGVGSEEARQRAEQARLEGVQVTPGQQFTSQLGGTAIGFTELLPIERLAGPLRTVLRGIPADKVDDIAPGVFNSAKRILATGGIEGFQEGMANVAQDLVAKGVYNPNLDVGQSALGDAAMGASVGAFAQGAIELLTKGKRTQMYEAAKAQERQQEFEKRMTDLETQRQEQMAQTMKNLGVPTGETLMLPAPAPKVEKEVERDPLMNPVGFFKEGELTKPYLDAVNKIRTDEGKAKIKEFSIEDLADAGAPQAEIDRLLTYKTGYDGQTKLGAEDVMNIAAEKNVDTTTVGFSDFLRRSTGASDLSVMTQPQLFSAFRAIDELEPSDTLRVLPPGTNATRFTQKQYDASIKNLSQFFPKNNMMTRDKVVKEIKDYSGLENDRDAESLLQTAIRNGDFGTTTRTLYDLKIPGDSESPAVRSYVSREAAERTAQKLGLEVRERTDFQITLPGSATQLPGGPDIRQGTFKQGVEPAAYEVRSPDAVLQTAKTQEEADAKADRLQALRQQKANGFLGQAAKIDSEIQKSLRKLEGMEADGKADTLEYKKTAAQIAANNKKLEAQSNELKARARNYTQPLEIAPKGEKPITREGYTLFEQGQPVATFPNMQAAEEAAIMRLPDNTLQDIVRLAPEQKGLMPKRLGKMAEAELARRSGTEPTGFAVPFTGTREQAEARLAEAGIFTGEFQKKATELEKRLRPIMDRLGLKDLRLNIVKAIQTPMGTADGSYAKRVIEIAMDAENPIRTLRHEGIHALKELGAFTPDQWRVLENKAKTEWMQKYDIAARYKGLTQAEQLEEAISDAFSDFDQTKAPPGLVGALFNKIRQFFDAMRNALKGMGFTTPEKIFSGIETGEFAPKGDVAVPGGAKYQIPRKLGTGKIVGAPPGLSTEKDRANLVRRMVNLLEHPFAMFNESKDWYERSGATIREITRGDPKLTEDVVRLMALYSQANSLGGNTTATIESIAQLARGDQTAFAGRFPNVTAARIPALLAAPTMDTSVPGVDDKLMNFYRNLHDATFQTDTFADASTIDRWMMRLFGYPHSEDQDVGGATGVSNTQYIYAKDLTRRIAESMSRKTGQPLLPRQVQAVLWTYVKNKTQFDSLPQEKQNEFVPSTMDFNDYVVRATANITWESRPSTKVDLIPGIHQASRQDQEAFNRAVREIFVDPATGEDRIFKLLGNQQLYSSQFSIGAYENLIAPNVITKLVLQKADGEYLTDVANQYAAIIGYVTKQDAVPWYRADPTASGKDASKGYRVNASVPATPEFEERLFKHLNDVMPGVGFTRVGDSFDFINFRDADSGKPFFMTDKAFIDKLQDALRTFAPDVDFNVTPFRAKSGWISNDWTEDKDGQGYLKRFSADELRNLQRFIDGWRSDYERIAEDFGREYGWGSAKSEERSGAGSGITLGEQQPEASTFDGVHYGKEQVEALSGAKYGTGIRGAEAKRLDRSDDPRIKKRAYFYIPNEAGKMPVPESGLGQYVYTQRFNNILGPGKEMSRLFREAGGDSNFFESAVVDAGYDGYAVPSMGMMVVLNHDVPVNFRGTRLEVEAKPDAEKIQIGDKKYSLRVPQNKEFKEWFGKSKIVDDNGQAKVMYHGTGRDVTEFKPKQANAIFVTESPGFAEGFSGTGEQYMVTELFNNATPEQRNEWIMKAATRAVKEGSISKAEFNEIKRDFSQIDVTFGLVPSSIEVEINDLLLDQLPSRANIMPVFVRAEQPFDFENPEHLAKIAPIFKRNENGSLPRQGIESGLWSVIESPGVQKAIREAGFDGFYVMEGGRKNLGVYSPNQIKSATGNVGTFRLDTGDIRYSLRESVGQDVVDAIDRTTTTRKTEGFADRIASAMSATAFQKFRQGFINKYESIERLSQDVAKQFGSNELLADTSAIASALFSDRAAGVAASSFRNGVPVYKDGFTTVSDKDGSVKGLIPILEPLMKYNDPFVLQAFQYYAATKRGKRLDAEGREKLFTQDDFRRGQLLEQQFPEFKEVFDEYQKYNKGLVDFMKDTGVISEKEAQIWTQNWDYLPFYRQMDGEETAGPKVFSPIAGVAKPKKLKGGEAPLADFMETIVRNSRAAIEAGMKNVAAQRVARDVLRLNQGELVPAALARGADIFTVKEGGQTKHYRVDDPLLVEALKGLNLPQLPFLEVLAMPSNVLRNLVTKDPGFMLANLMRDSLQAWVTTGTNITPIVDTFKQFGGTLANMSPEAKALAKVGLFTGYDFSGDVKSTAAEVEKELRHRTGTRTATEKALLPLSKMWDLLERGSTASDVATRAEVYRRVLKETGNEAEAMYQAMEVLNFSRKGNSALIRVLTALVPFMNARIQGLDVLYRSGFGKMATISKERQQKAFITRALTLFALSSMYWMLASDTEEYKTAEPEVRDNNWIIGSVRIPIPFEIGTVFKVFPERIYEYFFGMDTSKDLKESVVRNITSTLAFNPIPQAFLPAVENIANYSFFTGQPIVGKGMEDVAARFQATPGTSLLAQAVGNATNTSPMKIDNLIRGYTGTLGTYAVMALDAIMRGEGDPTKASMKAEQLPVVKRFFASPEGTGTISAYYDLKQQVDEAVRTINFLERTGGYEDLQAYLQDKGGKMLAIKPYIQTLEKDMTMLRDVRRAVQASSMEPDSKREVLDNIRSAEVALTSRIQYIKKSID